MGSLEGPELLVRLAVAAALAIAAVLALRQALRRLFGANVAYGMWALVPAVMLAAAFGRKAPPDAVLPVSAHVMPASGVILTTPANGAMPEAGSVVWIVWALGAAIWLSWRVSAQWRWRRRIGELCHVGDGTAYAAANASLPAAVGWPRPVVVLPADFDARFSEAERLLVLEHERCHVERGDLHAQMLAETIRALLWFHPLVHWAASRFRHDQELACDAEVMHRHPAHAATYARALVGAAGHRFPPVATTWGFSHPLKERIAMLSQSPRTPVRRRTGQAFVALLLLTLSGLAWASLTRNAPPSDGMLRQTWTFEVDGGRKLGPFLLVDAPGVPAEIGFDVDGESWVLTSTARVLPDGRFDVQATVRRGGEVIGQPRLVMDEKGAVIAIGKRVTGQLGQGVPDIHDGFRADVRVEAGSGMAVTAKVPVYPDALAAAGVEGRVMLRVAVDPEGKATRVRVEASSGHAALDEAAVSTVSQWRFTPAIKDGMPVAGEVLVPVDFRANDGGVAAGG